MTSAPHPEWTADFEVDSQLAQRLVQTQFPGFSPARVKSFDRGWDNTLFLVNETFVFRFPRRKIAVKLLEWELRALPMVRHKLPLPVPHPKFVGNPTDDFPYPFFGYPLLAGRTAAHANASVSARIKGAETLGLFLKALHAMPTAPFRAAGIGVDTMHRMVPEKRVPKAEKLTQKALDQGWISNATALHNVIQRNAIAPAPYEFVIVHGDFHIKNLLLNQQGLPCAVIDWGDVHLGHPATDLALGCAFLPTEGQQLFFQAYGGVDEGTRRLALFRALFIALVLLDYGVGIGDQLLVLEAKRSLSHVLEADAH